MVERKSQSQRIEHRTLALDVVGYLDLPAEGFRLARVGQVQFLQMFPFVRQRKHGYILLPDLHGPVPGDGHGVDGFSGGIRFRLFVREVDVIVDGIVELHFAHLPDLKLLDGGQPVLEVHQRGFHFLQPLRIVLIRLLKGEILLPQQRSGSGAFPELSSPVPVGERHIQVGVAVQDFLSVKVPVVLGYQCIGGIFRVPVFARIIEVLLVYHSSGRKHLQQGFQPLVDVECITLRKGEDLRQKQPIPDRDVPVAVDNRIFGDGLDGQHIPQIHRAVCQLHFALTTVDQDHYQGQQSNQ
ncbi:hypothetical protein EVA_01874 [gut metagenome]|uniref:Uncharacterized protein n=1 Tax=gut metagenome TaxID=749906 RepID=J9GP81_9ZZZZ